MPVKVSFLRLILVVSSVVSMLSAADGSDNPDSSALIPVVINEIMYHPYHPSPGVEDIKQEYIELFNSGTESVNLSGCRFSNGVDFVFGDVTIEAGQYVVVAADVDTFKATYPSISNVVGGWTGQLSNRGETIELVDDKGARIDKIHYADEGEWAMRELGPLDYGHHGWIWSDQHDGNGSSLELINANISNEYGQNWAASLINGGTPGAANSVADDNIAPLILDAINWPVIPSSDDAVTISAHILDELANGITAILYYREDGQTDFDTLTMFDDGQHDDGNPDDGVYAARIPAQPNGTIMEFYIKASDAGANSRTWPAPAMVDGTPQQVANALYQVNDSANTNKGWTPGSQPIYYLIMTENELSELEDIGDDSYSGNLFAAEPMSNAQMNATFISVDGVYTDIRYNVGVRNRGNRKRADPPMSYRVNFLNDNPWKNVTALNLNSKYPHLELMGSVMFQMAGLPAADVHIVQLRVNGQNLAVADYNRTYGSYSAIEVFDSDWAKNHFPDDPDGNLYRCSYYEDGSHPRTLADLDYKESAGQTPNPDDYRNNYSKKTNENQDDWSDLFALIDKLNNKNITDDQFVTEVSQVINLENWTRFLATDALLGNREGGLTSGSGDDYAMYRGIEDTRFWLVGHDLDTLLGQGDHDYQPQWDIFNYSGVEGLKRLLSNPDVIRLYYRQYKDLAETVFAPENIFPLIGRLLGNWVPSSEIEGQHGIKQFIIDRRNSILYGGYPDSEDEPQIPQQFSINSDLPIVYDFYSTTIPLTDLSGTFNAVKTRSIVVNGLLVDKSNFSQKNGTWSIQDILLNPGVNRIIAQAFDGPDGTGNQVEQGYIDVWYDTGSTNDFPKNIGGTVQVSPQTENIILNLIVRDSYLPGIPVLVRVELLNEDGTINRDLWDVEAKLSVTDNPSISLSTDRLKMYNGLGSALVSINGSGDFTLNVDVNGTNISKVLADWSSEPMQTVSGELAESQTWSGIYHITGGDFTIPQGITLTLNPGALVLIDGVLSGTNGADIDIAGSIESLGTFESPVTITAYSPGRNWGELHHDNAAPSTFLYTNITQAGNSPHAGHSNSGPAIRASGSTIVFENCSLTDNAGKIGHITSGSDLTFRNCLFARSVMGPEISGTALLFENSWITDMHANDDADGIYIHGQQSGQRCTLINGVAASMDDDGVDTLGSEVTIQDFIVRDCKDKGISIYDGQVDINYCLIVENNKAPEDPTIATIATKTVEGATAIVNIDHTTIVATKAAGHNDVGIQSHNKYGVTSGTIIYNVTNSIIDATDPVDVQSPYSESDIHISYSDIFGETWPGEGNLNSSPMFVDQANHDYRLAETSPCINAGNPAADPDPDLTVTDQGYTWFERIQIDLPPEGTVGENTIWTPQDGPYRITGELTVPSGSTLTILPGTTIFFDPDAKMSINGRLVAEGNEYEFIRFTRTPETGGTWDGIQFVDTMQDNRISYAVIEYGRTDDGMVGLENSNLLLDHVTFDNTTLQRIIARDSSLIVRNSTFTDTPAEGQTLTDNRTEHIWGSGVADGGWFIIENNIFGLTPGHNDAIDFDGKSRPNPIPQIMNNIFMGGGDDALDLECDAHIEGNLFMNYIKDELNRASGESNVISAGAAKHYVMVRNVFYNNDHVAQVKNDAYLTFVNNTVCNTLGAGIYFELGLPGRSPGQGAYLDGNIFWNTPQTIEGIDELTILSVNNSILPAEWHSYGIGNIDADPVFVNEGTDFHLKAGSPAIGTGPCGLDMGAYVPAGAAICGEPEAITYRTDATLTVGGPGITNYKYRINNDPWSEELSIDLPIVLNNLVNGQTYTVYAIGKNSAGIWQGEDEPTASHTWTIDTSYSKLVINEVLTINSTTLDRGGTFPDLVELHYDGPASISLSGMSITDNPNEPGKFVFPQGASIDPGEYLVLYADSETTSAGIHLGFALNSDGEGLYLYNNNRQLLDSVEFGLQLPDMSIGRIGYDGHWTLTAPTFGQANIAQPLGDPRKIKINEWLADGLVLFEDDFIELYNPQTAPVDLSSLFLTDNPVTQPDKSSLGPLSFITGDGFATFKADDSNSIGHLSFKLSLDTEIIGLFDSDINQIDNMPYEPQTTDVSYGRAPDGGDSFEFFELPTPGVSNPSSGPATATVINLVPEDADKRVLVPTEDIGEQWSTEINYDESTWEPVTGAPGGIGYERSSGYQNYLSIDLQDQMYNTNASCYIRIPFSIEANQLAGLTELKLKIRYDDGFVAYLNGIEIARRNFNDTPAWNSRSSSSHSDSAAVDFEDIDISEFIGNLKQGENLLAIHGLNTSLTSSDLLISAELDGVITMASNDFPYPNALVLLDSLRVTEIMYHAPSGSEFDYIELLNISDTTLDLTGVRFSDGIYFTFPAMTLDAGQYVVVVSNIASFNSAYGTGINVAGEYSGNLDNGGEKVVLSLPEPLDAAILRFKYNDAWFPATDGDGNSLAINDPFADPAGWSESKNWHATTPTPGW